VIYLLSKYLFFLFLHAFLLQTFLLMEMMPNKSRSLEGVLDELRSDKLVDGVAVDGVAVGDSDDEFNAHSALPGASRGGGAADLGARSTRPELVTTAIKFSPTGRDWAAASTQGLQIFSLDSDMLFAPTDLDVDITPQAVLQAIQQEDFANAVNMALHLGGEGDTLKAAVDAVPVNSLDLVVKSIEVRLLQSLLRFLADQLVSKNEVCIYMDPSALT
jgi:periodic tryptophan protein 2